MKFDIKVVANHILKSVGGIPKVDRFYNSNKSQFIDIFQSQDRPINTINTLATIGLSMYSIDRKFLDKSELRVEFIAASPRENLLFANVLATCSFNIISGEYTCSPGTVFPNIIERYFENCNMKHIMFVPPFLWNIEDLIFDDRTVTWLMAVPISDKELDYLRNNGSDKLEQLFEIQQIDFYDLNRPDISFS
ncbi:MULTISPECIES: suppressor of fused domain protein [unclassified Streptococcus]|uniref:suppressor of fused domain protein n=1 Tax=unclassified Streptococcus TaxID=2608887 RepID=UPI001072DACE|nr:MULTISPECIES: suppressor of fused domain protein [unclassified Streptococcus]MBF0788313.1 suppressor of fused domain protein [Streptococcus sp. 19428wC2_LYSM12]MCQ9210962.1 suppressor of fused domain protein [Streptococcus sp. B01]MCQ9214231.1 suppressor of fused domain protein [Streptococcus sp. O1]TFV04591.1 suppressor of fused domain protein [Streptococcus sp. LYSM12]